MSVVAVERLNLDGDDVAYFLIPEMEAGFGISFPRQIEWVTAGDILEAVKERIPAGLEPGLCATSMTFYRLRRATQVVANSSPVPSTPLPDVLGSNPSRMAKKLAAASGLRIGPPSLGWRGALGCLTLIASAIVLFAGFKGTLEWLALSGLLGVIMMKTDPGRYVEPTFGVWTKKVTIQNIGQLISLGADKRSQSLWTAIAFMLEDISGVPSDKIGYDTLLWPMEKKRAA